MTEDNQPFTSESGTARGSAAQETMEAEVPRQKRFSPEEIIVMLREADVRLGHGERVGTICARFGVSEQSYYRWRRQYGGLSVEQAKRIKRLERENAQLRKLLSSRTASRSLLSET